MLPSLRVWTVVQLEAVLPMLLKQAALSSYVEYGSRPAQFNCVCHRKLIKQKNVSKQLSHHNQDLQNKNYHFKSPNIDFTILSYCMCYVSVALVLDISLYSPVTL